MSSAASGKNYRRVIDPNDKRMRDRPLSARARMAYLIFTANGEEFARRELEGVAAVLGRAPDCDITVPDIMLSRHHCRVEPAAHDDCQGWRIVDLQSKNGTYLRGRPITTHDLHDGDELRLGRTRITFRAGAFVAPPK